MNAQSTRLARLKWTLCLAVAAGFAVSQPLWLTERAYPLAPLLPFWPVPIAPYDFFLYLGVFVLLFGVAISRRAATTKLWLVALLVAMSYLALSDQSRWHPWFYWDSFMLLALLSATRKAPSPDTEASALDACRMLLVASYVWSGAQKVNVTFFHDLFPWMLSAFVDGPAAHPVWSKLAFAVPILEILTGVLLLAPSLRRVGVFAAIATHLTILLLLGPLGHATNLNVWPWNLGLIALVWVLFGRDTGRTGPVEILVPRSLVHAAACLLFGVLPLLAFFDAWDAYPGFSLYSGSQRAAYVQLDAVSRSRLPPRLVSYVDEKDRLSISKWAMGEVRTPEYAEPRIYRALMGYLCPMLRGAHAELVIVSKPNRLTGARDREETVVCD